MEPKDKDGRLHLRVNSRKLAQLKRVAELHGLDASEFVRRAIDEKINRIARHLPKHEQGRAA